MRTDDRDHWECTCGRSNHRKWDRCLLCREPRPAPELIVEDYFTRRLTEIWSKLRDLGYDPRFGARLHDTAAGIEDVERALCSMEESYLLRARPRRPAVDRQQPIPLRPPWWPR